MIYNFYITVNWSDDDNEQHEDYYAIKSESFTDAMQEIEAHYGNCVNNVYIRCGGEADPFFRFSSEKELDDLSNRNDF